MRVCSYSAFSYIHETSQCMMAAAESEFIVSYCTAASANKDLRPHFLALPILMYHQPTHVFCITLATINIVATYDKLAVDVRQSDEFALATAAIETVRSFMDTAAVVTADLNTVSE